MAQHALHGAAADDGRAEADHIVVIKVKLILDALQPALAVEHLDHGHFHAVMLKGLLEPGGHLFGVFGDGGIENERLLLHLNLVSAIVLGGDFAHRAADLRGNDISVHLLHFRRAGKAVPGKGKAELHGAGTGLGLKAQNIAIGLNVFGHLNAAVGIQQGAVVRTGIVVAQEERVFQFPSGRGHFEDIFSDKFHLVASS